MEEEDLAKRVFFLHLRHLAGEGHCLVDLEAQMGVEGGV
jgi:hypothetical protein